MQTERPKGKNGLYCCPCCGYATLDGWGLYDICAICYWEDNGQDDVCADSHLGGPNKVSLTQGRINFLTLGANDSSEKEHCRPPSESDERLRVFVLEDERLVEIEK